MKKILLFVLSLWSIGLQAQNTEADNKTLIDFIRNSGLTPARVANALDAINYSKVSIVGIYTASGTNTYAVTAGTGITNNDANKQLIIKFTNANTSSTVTLNVNGIGALPLKTNLNADPDVGGIPAGSIYLIGSTGTTWRMIGPTNEGGVAVTNWGDIPTGNLDDQTDLYDTLNTKARKVYKIKPIASNYTASLGDHDNKLIIVNGGADFKIPKDADVDFPLGATLLAVDTLGTATFSADPLVTIDSTDQSQVWTKVAANKWTNFKSNSGSSSGAYWPLSGSATWTGNININGDGKDLYLHDADQIILQSLSGDFAGGSINGNVVFSAGVGNGSTLSRMSFLSDSSLHITSVSDTIVLQGTDIRFQTSNTYPDAVDRLTIDADGNHIFNGLSLNAEIVDTGVTSALGLTGSGGILTIGDATVSNSVVLDVEKSRISSINTSSGTQMHLNLKAGATSGDTYFSINSGDPTAMYTFNYQGGLAIGGSYGTAGQVLTTSGVSSSLPTWTTPATPSISGSATLNFDLTSVNYEDLTVTVTGAAAGDVVSIGVPNGAVVADVTYFGWVSATNTVSIRASRVGGGGAANPASGTFKVKVTP